VARWHECPPYAPAGPDLGAVFAGRVPDAEGALAGGLRHAALEFPLAGGAGGVFYGEDEGGAAAAIRFLFFLFFF